MQRITKGPPPSTKETTTYSNGTKNWITNGGFASVFLVIAQTDAEKGYRGINCLIVEKDMEGFVVEVQKKISWESAHPIHILCYLMMSEFQKPIGLGKMALDLSLP